VQVKKAISKDVKALFIKPEGSTEDLIRAVACSKPLKIQACT
jgi:hypothetical protein